jgi:Spy/CpxP family protein refolding chaperone
MFRSDSFDKQKALDLAKQRDADRDEMRNFMVDELAKFHAILTPDQRNKAADKMKEFREKRHEHKRDKIQKD